MSGLSSFVDISPENPFRNPYVGYGVMGYGNSYLQPNANNQYATLSNRTQLAPLGKDTYCGEKNNHNAINWKNIGIGVLAVLGAGFSLKYIGSKIFSMFKKS